MKVHRTAVGQTANQAYTKLALLLLKYTRIADDCFLALLQCMSEQGLGSCT